MRLICLWARWLYNAGMVLAQPLLRLKLKRRGGQEPGYLIAVEERFGFYDEPVAPARGLTIWLHAVSLGETRAAAPLIAAMRARWPDMRLLLTHGTATGRAEGAKLLAPGDLQAWQPWDTPGAMQRFLQHFKPDLGVLMETEIWPNLVAACQQHGVPLALASARMSDKSMRKARRLRCLSAPALASFSAVLAQTADDAKRLQSLGARPDVIQVIGNLKFDVQPDAALLAQGRQWCAASRKPVVLFASSREGEELAWAQAVLASQNANLAQWLIVPRHPQRFDEVAQLLAEQGMQVQRRSNWADQGPQPPDGTVVWLGDSLGEMVLYYGMSDLCLLGGSFAPLGGQNLIEAAACACPIVMGPHTFNFALAADQAVQAGAAWRVTGLQHGVDQVLTLLADESSLNGARQSAANFAQQHRGAAVRTVDVISTLLT